MKTIESEIAKSSNELASGSDSQTGFGAATTKSGLTDIGIPSMDESLSKLDIPAFEEIDTSNKDIVGLKNLGGKTKINFDKVTPKTDMKVLDNLGIFKNDAAEEFKQKKVLETLQPRVDSMEDVKVANIEQQIDAAMPTQPEAAIAVSSQMPDIMENPDQAIQNIEKDIVSSSTKSIAGNMPGFGGFDFGGFASFGDAFSMFDFGSKVGFENSSMDFDNEQLQKRKQTKKAAEPGKSKTQ